MYRFAVILTVLLTVGSLAPPIGGVGVAAAQEDGDTPSDEAGEDAADENDDESNEQEEATNDTVLHELGPDGDPGAVITNIETEGTTFRVTVEANEYTTISVNDASAFAGIAAGSSEEIAYETYTIPSDTTKTIEFDVEGGNGARAIAVTGHGTMIGIVETGFGGPFSGDVGWAVVRAGVAAAALVVGGTALVTSILTWYAMRRDYRRVI